MLARECAAYLGVSEAQLVLTNGLDEGLLARHGQRVPRNAELERAFLKRSFPRRRSRCTPSS